MKKLLFIAIALLSGSYAQADADLYPDVRRAEGRMVDEYDYVRGAFSQGVKDPALVLGALNASTYSCTYYFADGRRKDNVGLVIGTGLFGRNRSVEIRGTSVTIVGARGHGRNNSQFDQGPRAGREVNDGRGADERTFYTLEFRLGVGPAEGGFVVAVTTDSMLDGSQYLACSL